MGYYIETGTACDKTDALLKTVASCIELPCRPPCWGPGLVCVVENSFFDAAAYCFSDSEFEDFGDPSDARPKRWLLMDDSVARRLSGYLESSDQ